MRVLGLDAALGQSSVAIWQDGLVLAQILKPGSQGHAAALAPMVQDVLAQAHMTAAALDGVAVTVGPGSFTGLRAAIALAQGIALAAGCPIMGVTVAEALAEQLGPPPNGRAIWIAIDSRRGRVFLARGTDLTAMALDAMPQPPGPVAVAGDAAIAVAARLAARGNDVCLTDARRPLAGDVAAVGARRLAGALPALPAEPLYVDPPEAKLPAGGLRPPPAR